MIDANRIYRNLNKLPLFTCMDYIQSKRVQTSEAILINGFWRSGTTYFMEYIERLLNRRTFFEPLHYSVDQAKALHTSMGFRIKGDEVKQGYPFTLPEAEHSEYDAFYEAMLHGKVSTPWTRWNRKPNRYLQKDVIVKSVRANFIAPYLVNRFGANNIFIIRHPAAVLSSITRKGSGADAILQSVGSNKFIDLLLAEIEKGDPEKINKDIENAVEHYRGNVINNVILSWCICNYIPLQYIKEERYNPLLINYESFFLDDITKGNLYDYLSINNKINSSNFNSSTTKKDRKNISTYQRLYSWHKDLTAEQIDRVYEICPLFGECIRKIINTADNLNSYDRR